MYQYSKRPMEPTPYGPHCAATRSRAKESEYDDGFAFLQALPRTFTVYRVVSAPSKDKIDTINPGMHWTINPDAVPDLVERFCSLWTGTNFLIVGVGRKDRIHWPETLDNRIEYPDEHEIAFDDGGSHVEIVSIEELS